MARTRAASKAHTSTTVPSAKKRRRVHTQAQATDIATDTVVKAPKRRRRPKEPKPRVMKTPYDVEVAIEGDPDEPDQVDQQSNGKAIPKKKVGRGKQPVLTKQATEIADEVLDQLPAAARDRFVGCHVSIGGGIERAVVNAAAMGCRGFALDTRNKQRWEHPPLDPERAAAFRKACIDFQISPKHILPHGSYLINLASIDPEISQKSYKGFLEELQRCEQLGLQLYNFHPGSTAGLCTPKESLERIADCINRAHASTKGVTIVLENMAGAGNSVGHSFENLRHIIDHVDDKSRVGVCLDTCHLYAAGFDVSTEEGYRDTFQKYGDIVGWEYLKALHVNDSKGALSSKRDRHENIGRGLIGLGCFQRLMNDDRFVNIPLIMETPMQCSGPKLNYSASLRDGCVAFQETEKDAGECTDKRDVRLLYNMCGKK
ncbi:hypothetical protein WJX73_010676 [Symbiochloris irregularis]|uniref:Xylose isomerase-like TIM barrel domain-containing protein n=1 Tax=Symbiochloris irregularis TaxID=706552 RepID=A0AAW1NNL9_9CHLO